MSSALETFASNWKTYQYANYKEYVDKVARMEALAATYMEDVDALDSSVQESEEYTEEEKSIIHEELMCKKIYMEAIKNTAFKLVNNVAEAVVKEQNFLYGGGELMAQGFQGDGEAIYSYYSAIIKKLENSLVA